jgi:hypothetical protein
MLRSQIGKGPETLSAARRYATSCPASQGGLTPHPPYRHVSTCRHRSRHVGTICRWGPGRKPPSERVACRPGRDAMPHGGQAPGQVARWHRTCTRSVQHQCLARRRRRREGRPLSWAPSAHAVAGNAARDTGPLCRRRRRGRSDLPRDHGDAGDNRQTSGEWSASCTHRSNPEEPRHAGATRHGGRGEARRGIIPRFSMLSVAQALGK